eukprot:jgi/Chlat1/1803/Chrsp135S02142
MGHVVLRGKLKPLSFHRLPPFDLCNADAASELPQDKQGDLCSPHVAEAHPASAARHLHQDLPTWFRCLSGGLHPGSSGGSRGGNVREDLLGNDVDKRACGGRGSTLDEDEEEDNADQVMAEEGDIADHSGGGGCLVHLVHRNVLGVVVVVVGIIGASEIVDAWMILLHAAAEEARCVAKGHANATPHANDSTNAYRYERTDAFLAAASSMANGIAAPVKITFRVNNNNSYGVDKTTAFGISVFSLNCDDSDKTDNWGEVADGRL